jgi:hypothetical protein
MQLVMRNGELVAILGATRFFVVPEVEDCDPHGRDRRAISTACDRVLDEKRTRRRRHGTPTGAAPVGGASRAAATG